MQKAYLYEAIFLVNQGVDQTVRGLARLRKAAGITEEVYGDTLAILEHTRAQANYQFLMDMQLVEKRDAESCECRESSQEEPSKRGKRKS
jgi:hypothetical protein